MDSGVKALLGGFMAFVIATATVIALADERNQLDAMTIGGLTGGAVALSIWLDESKDRT